MFIDSRGSRQIRAIEAVKKEGVEHSRNKEAIQVRGVLKKAEGKSRERGGSVLKCCCGAY